MKIDGACHCGRIVYEAEIDPAKVEICHCTDCQSLSASAFRTVVPVPEAKFRLSGEPKIYVKTGESGAKRIQAFCGECGSQIYATSVGAGPKSYNLRLGTCRQRALLKPRMQYWWRSALPWIGELAAIPHVEKE
jgi:hypothetical protein